MPGCWAVYGEVMAKEFGEYRYPSVHRLTVDLMATAWSSQGAMSAISRA